GGNPRRGRIEVGGRRSMSFRFRCDRTSSCRGRVRGVTDPRTGYSSQPWALSYASFTRGGVGEVARRGAEEGRCCPDDPVAKDAPAAESQGGRDTGGQRRRGASNPAATGRALQLAVGEPVGETHLARR